MHTTCKKFLTPKGGLRIKKQKLNRLESGRMHLKRNWNEVRDYFLLLTDAKDNVQSHVLYIFSNWQKTGKFSVFAIVSCLAQVICTAKTTNYCFNGKPRTLIVSLFLPILWHGPIKPFFVYK